MKKITFGLILLTISLFIYGCSSNNNNPLATGKAVKSATFNNLTFTIITTDGVIKRADPEFTLSITDSGGKPVDAGALSLNFFMPAMGSMSAMNTPATLTTTGTPGVYRGKAKIEMGGEWQLQIAFEGAAGKGKTTMSVTVQ